MKRRLLKLGLFLLLGAIVNVAVAWAFAWHGPFDKGETSLDSGPEVEAWWKAEYPFDQPANPKFQPLKRTADYSVPAKQDLDLRISMSLQDAAITNRWIGIDALQCWALRGQPMVNMQRVRTGWPCRSLQAANWSANIPVADGRSFPAWDRGWRVERRRSVQQGSWNYYARQTGLPLRPLWPGFAINTVFYAAICWMMFATPFVLRRRLRIKRGLCPHCAYRVGTSPVCTECGTALPLRAAAEG